MDTYIDGSIPELEDFVIGKAVSGRNNEMRKMMGCVVFISKDGGICVASIIIRSRIGVYKDLGIDWQFVGAVPELKLEWCDARKFTKIPIPEIA